MFFSFGENDARWFLSDKFKSNFSQNICDISGDINVLSLNSKFSQNRSDISDDINVFLNWKGARLCLQSIKP